MVLIVDFLTDRLIKEHEKFPSPYGDYGSYHNNPSGVGEPVLSSFRPLTGIMVLIELFGVNIP